MTAQQRASRAAVANERAVVQVGLCKRLQSVARFSRIVDPDFLAGRAESRSLQRIFRGMRLWWQVGWCASWVVWGRYIPMRGEVRLPVGCISLCTRSSAVASIDRLLCSQTGQANEALAT